MNGSDFILAIDLGTTCAKMACGRAGDVEIIPNQEGQIQTPCAVWLNPQGRLVAGQRAKSALITDSANVQLNFVRDLGSSVEYEFPRASVRVKPQELTAEFLKSLRADAERFTEREIRRVVITVAPAAGLAQCAATKQAALDAGFVDCVLIQDAVAAALAANVTDDAGHKTVLIYDFGGGRFSASVLRVHNKLFQVVAHAGDSFLGGTNLDRAVVESFFIPALQAAHSKLEFSACNPRTREAYARLQAEAEAGKLRLSQADEVDIFVPRLCEDESRLPIEFQCKLKRAELERLAGPLVERTISICERVLADAHIATSEVNKLIPTGGMALMPFVRQRLQERFGQEMISVGSSVDPTTAAVRGAAIFAASQHLQNAIHPVENQTDEPQSRSEHSPPSASASFPDDDWEMIIAAQQPDSPARSAALETLVSTYYPFVIRCLLVEKRSREEAEDLAQGFLCAFWKATPSAKFAKIKEVSDISSGKFFGAM